MTTHDNAPDTVTECPMCGGPVKVVTGGVTNFYAAVADEKVAAVIKAAREWRRVCVPGVEQDALIEATDALPMEEE
jgi:proline racemase